MDRDDLLDAFACKKAGAERGKVFNVTDGTCGVCISVCPWTKRHVSRKEAVCPYNRLIARKQTEKAGQSKLFRLPARHSESSPGYPRLQL